MGKYLTEALQKLQEIIDVVADGEYTNESLSNSLNELLEMLDHSDYVIQETVINLNDELELLRIQNFNDDEY